MRLAARPAAGRGSGRGRWRVCDWCGGRVLTRAERRCSDLALDRVPVWACVACLDRGAYREPPAGWAGAWLWGRARPDRERLASLRSALLAGLAARDVARVEYVVGFDVPFRFWVWLGTGSDGERDRLASWPGLAAEVSELARASGLGLLYRGVTVESQETVDREYEGSWFYRLR